MAEQCKAFFDETCRRIEAAVKVRWPETLADSGALAWAQDHLPELYRKMKSFELQMDESWKNGLFEEMKRSCTEWGRTLLEIFKGYAAHLHQKEAA